MPQNLDAPILQSPYRNRKAEAPLTRYIPMGLGVHVDVLDVVVPSYLQEFTSACHKAAISQGEKWSTEEMLSFIGKGNTLWQCLEVIKFGIRCSAVSRIFSHQLVRARIGISYSQQCTGDVDSRHSDIIIPNCYWKTENWVARDRFIACCNLAKERYVSDVDGYGVSIQEARYLLPAGLTTFIYLDVCLGTLAGLFQKRVDTMTQTWEMVLWARRIRNAILLTAPWALPLFKHDPGKSWYHKTKDTPFANTHLWAPDAENDLFDWNPASFVHGDKTHEEVSSGPEGRIVHCEGRQIVSEEYWDAQSRKYGL